MKFRARTSDKRKLETRWDLIDIYVSRWKPGTLLNIDITRKQSKKSDPLRKYYFAAVLPPYMKELGYEPSEEIFFHHQLKITYFKKQPNYLDKDGNSIIKQDEKGIWRNVPSVFGNKSDIDVSIKKEYVDWVVRKAAYDGCIIDDPN